MAAGIQLPDRQGAILYHLLLSWSGKLTSAVTNLYSEKLYNSMFDEAERRCGTVKGGRSVSSERVAQVTNTAY